MAVCGSLLGRIELSARNLNHLNSRNGLPLDFMIRVDVPNRSGQIDCYRRVSASLKSPEPQGNSTVLRCFGSNIGEKNWSSNPFLETGAKHFSVLSGAPYSAGAASNAAFDGSIQEDQLDNTAVSSDKKVLEDKKLKLLSGSYYLPHPDKEETGGEDAHFICTDEQAIGVADGVGGWADMGIDAGQYARELMSHSVSAIQEEPKGSVDPARVLEKAYSSTKARGSSTACIVALTDQVFTFPVATGDVIIAGTDGLFDNLFNNEVTSVVVEAVGAGLGPQVTSQRIAVLAQWRAQDRNRQTPLSTAAQDAGYWYNGGKLDDITVVVSYITASNNDDVNSGIPLPQTNGR